ncbi:hypothetical protein C4568_04260 [Candidatus Parcubacteria bacterium]|nr:MAG: hypothetical protein C4568_04260 [Candidatus Parcubacteria bacterium]
MEEKEDEIEIPERDQPVVLSEKQKWLCSHLDTLNRIQKFCPSAVPSELYRGALYVTRNRNQQTNPDWMAQAAHSLREIMYSTGPLKKPKNRFLLALAAFFGKDAGEKTRRERIEEIIKFYQEEKKASELARVLNDLHFIFTNIAHHFQDGARQNEIKKKLVRLGVSVPAIHPYVTEHVFEQLIEMLENAWTQSIPRQLTIHERIDEILSATPTNSSKDFLGVLLSFNPDAKQYFFAKADEQWLDWLWQNGFLNEIKQPAEDSTRYGYRTPEISYLAKVAEKVPNRVVQIMLDPDTATTKEKFKPELIDQFLRVSSSLSADQLALIIPKLHSQEWVRILAGFNHWGFEYEKMFKTLLSAKDYKNLLLLAKAVLSVRTKEEVNKTTNGFGTDNPFYFSDFEYTGVFESLLSVSDEFVEDALRLATGIMSQVVLLGGRDDDPEHVFSIKDSFYLFDIDFFSLAPNISKHLSYRDDVKELAAVIKTLVDRSIGTKCDDEKVANHLYDNYIDLLPDSQAMWRLRLYVLSLCPNVFKDKIKNAFFRLFDSKYYSHITSGTEYEKALRKGFGVLSNTQKRDYVAKTIAHFSSQEKGTKEERWHLNAGSDIFSVIESHLTDTEREEIAKAGFEINPEYEPIPSVMPAESGYVQSQGPISQEEFGSLPIEDIAKNLRDDWSPKALRDKYRQTDSFLNPHNAEGAGDLLKNDIPKRLQEYVDHAEKFFERDELDQHYTYSFLRGIEDAIKNNRSLAQGVNWDGLVAMLASIKSSGQSSPFDKDKRERDSFDAWLAGWNSVHSGMTDVVQALLREETNKTIIDFLKYRDQILEIISYLLDYPEPTPDREDPKDPIMSSSVGGKEQLVSDPFAIAINTVRGRAFQALVLFIYPDGRELPEGARIKDDVKSLYERVLAKEDTRALMFMFGHYIPQFYFRDVEWHQRLLPKIFPTDAEKSHLFLAAWEGYLSNNLYKELFTNPVMEQLYYRGLSIADIKETTRQYFKDPDEGSATHIALAYMHYEDFGFEHPLFKKFWEQADPKQHQEFVSFLGRSFVSGDNAQVNEYLKKEPRAKELLKSFWDWSLENHSESELFEEFGFWANLDKELFEPAWLAERLRKTLEKTKGKMEWDYGLTQIAVRLCKEAPTETIAIARLIFLDGGVLADHPMRQFYLDSEWLEVFKNLYANPETQKDTEKLINDLIEKGGSPFWSLKDVMK